MRKETMRAGLIGAALVALSIGAGPAFAQTQVAQQAAKPAEAPKVDPKAVWDLTPLFKSVEGWDAERKAVLETAKTVAALKGTIGKDAKTLLAALDAISALNQRAERVLVYAFIDASTNQRDAKLQERRKLAGAMNGEVAAATAWLAPEVQEIGAEKIEAFVRAEPGLAKHAFGLRDALRLKAHTLTKDTESALAAFSPVFQSHSDIYGLLTNADITWPTVKLPDGTEVKLNNTGYVRNRQHPDRAVRKLVFDTFWPVYGQFADSMGAALGARIQAGVIDAKLRKHPTAVAASLAANNIPESVYRTLVAETNKGLPTLHRYFKLRQRMLNLPDLGYHDIYPAMVKLDRKFPIDEAVTLTLAATKPLGSGYVDELKGYAAKRQSHVFPAEGKDSGAYQWGAYGTAPYVFLNHQDDFNSVSTYAHEWGHGMHTALANKNQPYETAGYSLFIAEIAAITNEILLSDYMLNQAETKEERLFYLGEALEQIRGTFFRQTMFAEFELATHDAVERGEAVTGAKMTEIYCDLLKRYHGHTQGVMKIEDAYCAEWAYIPHFYRPFYVYQYATSIAAAAYFADEIEKGGQKARENYLNVLRAGGSRYPYDLLKGAGLDMAGAAPYQALLKRMNAIMDEMEKLLNEKK